MSHVDDGKLNALLDGELDSADSAAVQAHIAGCSECAKRLEEAKRFLAEAADLLGALEVPKQVAVPDSQPRRVSKTAKEVALELDAATQQSPAIGANPPERLWRRGPRGQQERHGFDYTSLAWAATIVLAIGVGYLANEVRHARSEIGSGEGSVASRGTTPASAPAGAPAAEKGAAGSRTRVSVPGTVGGVRAASGQGSHGPPAAKAPPGAGVAQLAGRSTTGLGHKRLDVPAQRTAVRPPPARPTEVADVVQAAPTAAAAPAPALGNASEARPPQAAAGVEEAGAPSAAGGAAPHGAAVGRLAASRDTFHRASLEEAVARLQGTIRLIDGMRSDHVEIVPGRQVPGADSGREVVRVVYGAAGHELVLNQQRIGSPDHALAGEHRDAQPSGVGMRFGDTLLTTEPDGQRRMRWLDRGGFWLSLTGRVPADSLRRVAGRVR